MNDNQKLVILTTLKGLIDDEVSSLRGKANALILDTYAENGCDRMRIPIGDVECATLSIRRTKPSSKTVVYIEDRGAAVSEIAGMDASVIEAVLSADSKLLPMFAEAYLKATGESLPGTTVAETISPEKLTTMLKVDNEAAKSAMAAIGLTSAHLALEAIYD